MSHATYETTRKVVVGAVVLGALGYLVTLLPGVRSGPGFDTGIDGWYHGAVFVLVAVSAVVPVVLRARDRWFWGLIAAAVVLRVTGFVVYWAWIRTLQPQPYPSVSDGLWMLSALAMVAALLWAIGRAAPGLTRVLVLDAVIACLASAAIALALLYPTLRHVAGSGAARHAIATNLAYPVVDVVLLVGVVALGISIRSQASFALRLTLLSILAIAVVDCVFLYQVTAGTWRPAGWLSGLSMVATATMGVSAWFARPTVEVTERISRIRHTSLVVPVVFASLATGMFVYDAFREVGTLPMMLGVAAVFVAMLRGNRTVSSDRTESRRVIRRAEDERLKFQSLVETSNDFIAIAGIDGKVLYVNPEGRALVGMTPDTDVTDTTIADYLTPEGVAASLEVEQPAVIAQGHWEGESTLRHQVTGEEIPVAINSFLMKDPASGEPIALATVQRDISELVAQARVLQTLAEQRAVLLDRLVRAEEAERARIAADVHDDSVQALAVVDLRLGLLTSQLGPVSQEQARTLHDLRTSVTQATERLRRLLFDLEQPTAEVDLAPAVGEAASHLFQDTSIAWRVTGDGGPELSESARATAYRIAKEAMVNVLKHSDAGRVEIRVESDEGAVRLSVLDDGRGFAPQEQRDRPGHLGLAGMADRATVAGGRLEVDSEPGRGTAVRLWLPAPEAPEAPEAKK